MTNALGAAIGKVKSCVEGATDISRASITFSSSGTVGGVKVMGWAASNGASDCIISAFREMKVGPFSQPTFTVGITIRP